MPLDQPPDNAYADILNEIAPDALEESSLALHAGKKTAAPNDKLPHNVELEQGLLGALLIDNRQFERVSEIVDADDFYAPAHRRIFDAIGKIIGRGGVASPIGLKQHFANDEDLKQVGGGAYLADLAASTASILSVRDYAEQIADLSIRRGLCDFAREVLDSAMTPDIDVTALQLVEEAEKTLYHIAEQRQTTTAERPFASVLTDVIHDMDAAYRGDGKITGLSTGLIDIDRKTGGLMPEDLIILAARPSMGKSALAANIAFEIARRTKVTTANAGATVAFYSLEMSAKQIGHRLACGVAGVDNKNARDGNITHEEFTRVMRATQEIASVPLYIDGTPRLTVSQLRTRARRIKRKHGLGLIVVDYIQLMKGSGRRQSEDNRAAEVSEISQGLKAIAKELGVPVLALSQLSRTIDQRDDKRPQLSDLRESGSLEQDADVVMFVYRDEYYLAREEPKRLPREKPEAFTERTNNWVAAKAKAANVAEVIFGKQRMGPVGVVKLHFDGPTTRFTDLHAHYSMGGDTA